MFSFQVSIPVGSSESPQGSTLESGSDSTIQREVGEATPGRLVDIGQADNEHIRGTGERGGGEEVIGFQGGAGTRSGSKTIHHIPKSGIHLLFMSLTHAPHAMVSLRIQVLLAKRTSQPIVKNFDPQPHRKYVVKCSVGEESILTPGRRCLQPSICQWRRVRRQASPTTEVMLVHQP